MEVYLVNKNIKALATIIPLIVVPLINERKNISKHPDMKKLGQVSSSLYNRVKDSSKETATNVYQTSKDTAANIGSKVSHRLEEHNYNKQNKDYKKRQVKEESLEQKFDKDKENHREKRLAKARETSSSIIPKIFQSSHEKSDSDKMDGMTVSDDVTVEETPLAEVAATQLTHPDNQEADYGEPYMFREVDEDDSKERHELVPYEKNELQSIERADKVSNIQELNEEKVYTDDVLNSLNEKENEEESLHKKHKRLLDPRSHARDKHLAQKKQEKAELHLDNSLFNKHRRYNLEQINKRERKITKDEPYIKDQSLKNYEALMFNK
jgi:hypothetical protein